MNQSIDKAQYITLAEAADHAPYTQEYLSLRARQGKLRAVKSGRSWVTTLGWLDDYLEQVSEAKNQLKEAAVAMDQPASIDKDFSFQPAPDVFLKEIAVEGEEPAGSAIADEPTSPIIGSFSWEEEEPGLVATYAQQRTLEDLERRLEDSLTDEPVYELAEELYAPSAAGATSGMHAAMESGLPSTSFDNISASIADNSTDNSSKGNDIHRVPVVDQYLLAIVRPLAVVTVAAVIMVGTLVLNEPLKLSRNLALGTGVVLTDIGNALVGIGITKEANKADKLQLAGSFSTAPVYGYPAGVSADTPTTTAANSSEKTVNRKYQSNGQVAGYATEKKTRGFWATVWLGVLTITGQELVVN